MINLTIKVGKTEREFHGGEPSPPDISNINDVKFVQYLNWHTNFYDPHVWKSWVIAHLEETSKSDLLARYRKTAPKLTTNSIGVVAKLLLLGKSIPPEILESFYQKISLLCSIRTEEREPTTDVSPAPKPRKETSVIADIEDIVDEFYRNEYVSDFSLYEYVTKKSLPKSALTEIADYYRPILEDVRANPKDFSGTKIQFKNYITFLEMLVGDSSRALINKKIQRKPRAKKKVTEAKLVSKVQFKKQNMELQLASLSPEGIIGSSALFLYNDKYKVLTVLIANEGGFTVKGTTVYNFNEKTSFSKTIRKPEQVKTLIEGTKASILKRLNELSTKPKEATGRLNHETLLLRIFK